MKIDLRGNVKNIGSVFMTASVSRNYDRRLVQRLVTVETEPPGRRGRGWGLLVAPRTVVGFGIWRVPEEPAPVSEAREANEVAHQIPNWRTAFEITAKSEPDGWTIVPMEEAS